MAGERVELQVSSTIIEGWQATASGTRTCLVCEKIILDRSLVLTFKDSDGLIRITNEEVLHPECAEQLAMTMLRCCGSSA